MLCLFLRDEIISVFSRLFKFWEMKCSLVSVKSIRLFETDVRVGSVGGCCASLLRMVSLVECAAAHFMEKRSFAGMRSIFGRLSLFASIVE